MYDLSKNHLARKLRFLIEAFNSDVRLLGSKGAARQVIDLLDYSIKWSRAVKRDLGSGRLYVFDPTKIITACYRPLFKTNLYRDSHLNEMPNLTHQLFGKDGRFENSCLVFTDAGSQKPFMVTATNCVFDYHFVGAAAAASGIPRFRYASDSSRLDNITDWALDQFRAHYERAPPSPLAGEGVMRSMTDEGAAQDEARSAKPGKSATAALASGDPSSDPTSSGHLLPQGEKGQSPRTRFSTMSTPSCTIRSIARNMRRTSSANFRAFPSTLISGAGPTGARG